MAWWRTCSKRFRNSNKPSEKHGVVHRRCGCPKSPVGAGLPAKAVCHPTSMSTDPPPSLASQLLQLTGAEHRLCGCPKSPVGAGLPAKTVCHPTSKSTDPPPSPASQLLQLTGAEHKLCGCPRSPAGAGLPAPAKGFCPWKGEPHVQVIQPRVRAMARVSVRPLASSFA
jgi:hypothetical protein